MQVIEVRGGDIEQAIHELKRMVSKAGILTALRHREEGHKASDRRKLKVMRAERRRLKRMGNGKMQLRLFG